MKVVLVCGGRDFGGRFMLREILNMNARDADLIVHGDAPGADTLAKEWAECSGIPTRAFPADWKKHGRAAGPIRNQQMLDEGKPTLVIAFPGGRGTMSMIQKARKAGVNVINLNSHCTSL